MTDPSARIITHMNKDHHLAVLDYVVVYGNENLKDIDTSSVRITNVTEEHLVLAYKKQNRTRPNFESRLEYDRRR
ncbi:hypothetical protein OXX69_013236 [Metschnikowia pulcherrima]